MEMETAPAPTFSNEEQARLLMAQSAETMTSTAFWKALMKAMAVDEANALIELGDYLAAEAHPDREEVMTLCLKWHALRTHRGLLLRNVKEALDYKAELRNQVFRQFMDNPDLPVPEESEI